MEASGENYIVFHPRHCGLLEVFKSLFPDAPAPAIRCTPSLRHKVDGSWQAKFSMFLITVLHTVARGLAVLGHFLELGLNIFNLSGGILQLAFRISSAVVFRQPTALEIPAAGSTNYLSIVGLVDPRTDLLIQQGSAQFESFASENPASKRIADACMMASKLAYENPSVIRKIVTQDWKMHLVGVYECMNKYFKTNPTQLMIMTDREQDAQAIVLAFRGTVPFNGYDWSMNFDFSWYELPGLGRLHVGFLEALSLVDRQDMTTFLRLKKKLAAIEAGGKVADQIKKLISDSEGSILQRYVESDEEAGLTDELVRPAVEPEEEETPGTSGGSQASVKAPASPDEMLSGLPEATSTENIALLAYDVARFQLKELLSVHKDAKVYVTGHSLGGALATMFTSLLFKSREEFITERIAAVYTFGQPRAGDRDFAAYTAINLNDPENRYFRLVYARDLVPRLPYEDIIFQFRHLGPCFFYSSSYDQETVTEEPSKSLSSSNLPDQAAATWEIFQSFLRRYKFGDAYKESLASTIFRLIGLLFPGVAAHSPVNYVNAIRLGPELLDPEVMPPFENQNGLHNE